MAWLRTAATGGYKDAEHLKKAHHESTKVRKHESNTEREAVFNLSLVSTRGAFFRKGKGDNLWFVRAS
jgi:hypothetical protein